MSEAIDKLYAERITGRPVFDPHEPASQAINPPSLFDGSSFFSQIIVAPIGRTVWISGLIGVDPDNRLVGGGKREQLRQVFSNVAAAIAAAGCRPEHCTRVTEYIVDYSEADLIDLQHHLRQFFELGALPTNVVVPVARLGRDDALIEIELSCVRPEVETSTL